MLDGACLLKGVVGFWMPVLGSKRCKACLIFKPERLVCRPHAGIGGGRRCTACKGAKRERRFCARCGDEHLCRKRGLHWMCVPCTDAAVLRSGDLPAKRTLELPLADKVAYLALHYALRADVQIWIVPLTRWCPLLMFRFVLWRRFGILAGILPGPPTGVFTRLGGVRQCDRMALGLHFRGLVANGLAPVGIGAAGQTWPSGTAPVVVTGTCAADLGFAKMELPPADRDRLVPFLETLSERRATTGWSRRTFNQSPCAAGSSCVLVQRAVLVLQAAGLPHANNPRTVSENSHRGKVYRALHSGSKH